MIVLFFKVTTTVVLIIENVVKSSSSNKSEVSLHSNTSATLLETLQQQLDNVRDSGLSFNLTTPNMAVRIVRVERIDSLIIYKSLFSDDDADGTKRDVTEGISNDVIEYAPTDDITEDNEDEKVSIKVDSGAITKRAQFTNG